MATSARKLVWPTGRKALWLVWLPGYLLCGAGFLLCVVSFYPGYISPDSIRQLSEGRAWSFTDWHPPLMAAVWGIVDRFIPGPAGMLLLHNAAFWGALGLFWRETYRRSVWLGLSLVVIGFLPTTLALLSTIWKDVGFGVSLLSASALLYTARRTNSRGALLGSLPLLFYGYGVRQNAAPAILPLALWTGSVACRVFPSIRRRVGSSYRSLPFVLGLACFLCLTVAVLTTTWILTGGRSSYLLQTVLLHDLTAISKERGEALFPDYILRDEGFSLEKASTLYQPYIATPVIEGRGSGLKLTEDPLEITALRAKWLEVVAANKGVYLRHRWEAFKWATGYGVEHVCFPYLATSHRFGGYDVNERRIHQFLRALFWKLRDTFFFRGFVWLLLSFVLLCRASVGRLRDDLEPVFVLSLSGFLYGVAYFFFATSCDFRFFWWTALASLVSLCFAVSFEAGRMRTRRAAAVKSQSKSQMS
ncbi:MAG: hypothetical protein QOC99_110 [Acidobacteriota bacterium]|jgi:hypothetical protein|nr:hypothetical protein [Acidobacteriota bacterium]